MAETHIAGNTITWDGRYMRQRCSWCGAVLIDYDLDLVGIHGDGQDGPSGWPTGVMVRTDGALSYVVEPEQSVVDPFGVKVPDDACLVLDPEVTR